MARINIELPQEVHRKAKAQAALKGMNFKDYVIEALQQKLKERG